MEDWEYQHPGYILAHDPLVHTATPDQILGCAPTLYITLKLYIFTIINININPIHLLFIIIIIFLENISNDCPLG